MKIAMLARNPNLYSHQRLKEAAEERGHHFDILNTTRCTVHIASHRPEVYYNGEPCVGYDAVIPRIGASITNYGLAILRQFEMRGCWPLNESVAIGRSRDKLRSMQILAKHGLGLPLTAYANDPKQAEEIIRAVKGPPVVIKLLEGTQGIGVVLAETMSSAKSVIEAFRGANVNILVQEFIKEAGGTDIRALVIGGKVVAAMTQHCRACSQTHGTERLRRGYAAIQSWPGDHGSEQFAGAGRHRECDRQGYCRHDHRFRCEKCPGRQDHDQREGVGRGALQPTTR